MTALKYIFDTGGTTIVAVKNKNEIFYGNKHLLLDSDFRILFMSCITIDFSGVDYQIKDNPAVSRLHAELITKDEGYFIKDSNSTNNTFVNGKEIESGEEVQIFDGDEIIMADETFEFHEE